jgi:DNA-binding MarR family transcriptional regulator
MVAAAHHKPTFNDEERAYARALLLAVEPFLQLRPTMPLQYLTTYLRVVADEGKGVSEYADHAGIAKTVMTRQLLDIGERSRDLTEGFGLVYQNRDPHDLRVNRTYATPKGRTVFLKMMDAIKTLVGRKGH